MESEQSNHDGGKSLPEDIVFHVLARLPAKPLCRFRCVCKGWRALISHPAFVAAQRPRAGPHLVGVFFNHDGSLPEVRLTDMDGNVVRVFRAPQQAPTRIRLIVHGLNTCFGAVTIDPAAGCASTIFTGTHWASSSFGGAALSGSFKVLFVGLTKTLPVQPVCRVTTIVEGSTEPLTWRQRSEPPFDCSKLPQRKATVNGVVYFLPPTFKESDQAGRIRIAAFDLESEEWKIINGPAFGFRENIWNVTLTELKGCFGVVQFIGYSILDEPYDEHCYAVIWLLVDPTKSVWVKEHTIEMPKTWRRAKQFWALDDGRILFRVNEKEKVTNKTRRHRDILVFYSPDRDILVFYSPGTKTFTKFMDIAMGLGDILLLYTGSLLS